MSKISEMTYEEAEERVLDCLMENRMLFNQYVPFLGHLVNNIPWQLGRVGTACVSDEGELGLATFDPWWMRGMSRGQVGTIALHETLHPALGYFFRALGLDDDDANTAHDHVVNWVIQSIIDSPLNARLGLEWPTGEDAPLLDEKYRGLILEEVYELIRRPSKSKKKKKGGSGSGDADASGGKDSGGKGGSSDAPGKDGAPGANGPTPNQGDGSAGGSQGSGQKKDSPQDGQGAGQSEGSGRGSEGGKGGRGGGQGYRDRTDCVRSGNAGGEDGEGGGAAAQRERLERQANKMERLLHEANALQEQRGIGKLPGAFEELIGKILKPKVDWFEEFSHFVQGHLPGGARSYRRPSKRSEAVGAMLPGRGNRKPRIWSVWDTSGSIDKRMARNFGGALRQIGDITESEMRRIMIDVEVTADDLIEDFDALEFEEIVFKGRGGTNFDILPEYLLNSEEDLPDLLVFFTDGFVDWCDYALWPCPILVVTTNAPIPAPYPSVKLKLAA